MISLVILAAGKSTRMKENKLLLKVDGKTLIERTVDTAKKSNADEVIVVLGYESDRIREKIEDRNCRLVVNDAYEKGQSGSVKLGLSTISRTSDAIMFLPADVALIDPQSINRVIEEYKRSGSPIVIASHDHQSGHPILLDRTIFPEISRIDEQTLGLKAVIDHNKKAIKYVEVGTGTVLIDIDTEEEFKKHFR